MSGHDEETRLVQRGEGKHEMGAETGVDVLWHELGRVGTFTRLVQGVAHRAVPLPQAWLCSVTLQNSATMSYHVTIKSNTAEKYGRYYLVQIPSRGNIKLI